MYSQPFTLQAGDLQFSLVRIQNVDELFDELLKKSTDSIEVKDERIPYWSELWPSAIAMAEFISENKSLFEGKRCIEIGCGLGLPSMAAKKCGADTLLTDYIQQALDFATYNWKLNFSESIIAQLLDWRAVSHMPKFDIVLASDVAYESRSFDVVIQALKHLLSPTGFALITEPNRHFASPFVGKLKENFSVEVGEKKVVHDSVQYKVFVYRVFHGGLSAE